jgi:hypothetical protein
MTGKRIPLTRLQAEWLEDIAQSGSEAMAKATGYGATVDYASPGRPVLVIPEAAGYWLGLAVGLRADIADEGEYRIGERSTVLGLARKLANAGLRNAAPLTEAAVFGTGDRS